MTSDRWATYYVLDIVLSQLGRGERGHVPEAERPSHQQALGWEGKERMGLAALCKGSGVLGPAPMGTAADTGRGLWASASSVRESGGASRA